MHPPIAGVVACPKQKTYIPLVINIAMFFGSRLWIVLMIIRLLNMVIFQFATYQITWGYIL